MVGTTYRPNLSTSTRLTMLKREFVPVTVIATAVALVNPTMANNVGEKYIRVLKPPNCEIATVMHATSTARPVAGVVKIRLKASHSDLSCRLEVAPG